MLKGPGAGSVQFGRIKADRVNATSFATGRPRKEEFLQMSSFLRQPTALPSRKGTYKLFKSACEKSQSLKNVVKKNRSRDHNQLAAAFQTRCIRTPEVLSGLVVEVNLLKEATVTSAASTTVSQKWKGEARSLKDLGFSSSPFSTPCNNSREWS